MGMKLHFLGVGGWVVFCWVSAVAVLPNAFPCTKQFIALLSWPLVLCLWG